MTDTILLPLDGTRAAETALPWARNAALASSAAVQLLNVISLDNGNGNKRRALRYLQDQQRILRQSGVKSEPLVLAGDPAQNILDTAVQCDITVMTSGTVRWLISAVLDRVLQDMTRPLVVVRAHCEGDLETDSKMVLVPIDTSLYSSDILPVVRDVALSLGSSITLCHVIPPIGEYVTSETAPPGIASVMREMIEESRELTSDAAARLYQHGIMVKTVTTFGDPAAAIVREAESCGAGLIAMATRGRDRLHKRMEGSVAQTVLETTHIPCLLVRSASISTN